MAAPARARLRLSEALALGLAQGPTELLPVSSSAHTTLIPLLLGWRYAELDAEPRKSFELALHAGAGAALALDMRRELLDAARRLDRRRVGVIALSLAPAALA
ncbi:MAG TPA: undecaprenyl-diphosphate phosphatase, partial [Solirubrobacteraceae bacterium]